jgi:putative membrane protein
MRSRLATIALLALVAAAPAWAQSEQRGMPTTPTPGAGGQVMPQLNQQDREFLQKAAAGSMGEVEMGRLAMKNAAGPAVREFGRWMATDHGAINEALDRLSRRMGVTLPTSMSSEDQAALQRLQGLKGRAFDQQYLPLQMQGHQQTIALFEREEQSGQEPVLKALARHTLPMLQEHMAEVQELSQLPVASQHGGASAGSSVAPHGQTSR